MLPEDDDGRRHDAQQRPPDLRGEREEMARALAAEQRRLRITLESIGDGVISTDAEARVVYLNPTAEALTGWTREAAAGVPITEVFRIVNEQTRQTVENPVERALREGTVVGLANHTLLLSRDGTERPIDDSAAPMLDESGKPVGAVLVFRDVSERRRAELVNARLAAIVGSSDDAIVSKDLDGIIQSWNRGAERIFGYTAAEVVGRSITLLIPPERLHEETDILSRLRRGERVDHFETIRVAKGGRRVVISLTVSPIHDAEGNVVGASKVARDVTQQHRDQEALEASELRFRTLAAHAPVGIVLTTGDGNYVFVNDCWTELAGTPAAEALGDRWVGAVHPDDRGWVREEWYGAVAGELPFGADFRLRSPGGIVTWVNVRAVPLRDSAGKVTSYIGTLADVTERRSAVEALEEAGRRKDEFLALLAHELRNPLAPLRNGLQVMRLGAGDPALVARAREMMERQLGHMVRLIDDLLDVSRISRNKLELRRSRVLLGDVLSSAVETVRPAIEAAGHQLHVDLPTKPVFLDADLTRLAQVFGNLLNNSAKYTEPGGRIWLAARHDGDRVTVAVRDTGIGIPAEALNEIFDLFSQLDRPLERGAGGLGIGLSLVKGLVEMHGGTVTAASPGPGQGSTFTVTLPVLERDAETPDRGTEGWIAPPAGAGLRILVADDNVDAATSLATMLHLLGNEVRAAHDGEDAVAAAEEFRPHLILMDLGMPRLSGYEATQRIRERPWGGEIRIIALTGWGQDVDRERSHQAGCDGHLVKPVSLADLQRLLGEVGDRSLGAR